jgi:hypothetical protein
VNQTEPTARPWSVEWEEYGGYDCMTSAHEIKAGRKTVAVLDTADYFKDGTSWDDQHARNPESEANAALIVRAVNSYDKLTAALAAVADWAQDKGELAGKTPSDVAEYCRKAVDHAEGQG